MTQSGNPSRLIDLCDEALIESEGDDVRSTRVLAFRTWGNLLAGHVGPALADGRSALEKAERVGDPAVLAVAIARLSHAEAWAGEITPGLIERGAEVEERAGLVLGFDESPRYGLAHVLLRLGELDRARAILEETEANAAAHGNEGTRVVVVWTLSLLEWFAGRLRQALDHALTAHELTEQTRLPFARAWVGRAKALVEADLGLVDEARASAGEALEFTQTSNEFHAILALGVLGRLELALGNLDAAAGYLRELPGRLLAGEMNDPAVTVWPDAIETLISLGQVEPARSYLERYELRARRLGGPWALAAAARCRGLLHAAETDPEAAFEAFARALTELDDRFPFERGRTLLCLGTVRRQAQQRKAAREALDQALDIFERLPAPLWTDKAQAELARISGRRASDDELTETEHRVAVLAAQGHSNKEIAAELFMGLSTVEAHLSRVYRKLGIRSRNALGPHLAIRRDTAAQP
jgi:ATP/maltotriose-dependent transcriptional regulator MalT